MTQCVRPFNTLVKHLYSVVLLFNPSDAFCVCFYMFPNENTLALEYRKLDIHSTCNRIYNDWIIYKNNRNGI